MVFGLNPAGTSAAKIDNTLNRIGHTFLSIRSLIVLILCIVITTVVGRLIAALLRRIVNIIGNRADKSNNLQMVNRLRRYETMIVLSIAVIRSLLFIFGLYFWWEFVHPAGQPTAVIGASALALIVVSGALSAPLRDITAGSLMMAEQWYGVGDQIKIEPFGNVSGVVDRVTLRSTRIRALNGEITWISNQNIQGVSISPKGIRTMGLEIFVTDITAGEKLIEATNKRLPIGPLLVVTPLAITTEAEVGEDLWHITAVGETAPDREWLIERSAVELMQKLDAESNQPIIAHGPLARYADSEAERRFARSIHNAQKLPAKKRKAKSKVSRPAKRSLSTAPNHKNGSDKNLAA